MSGSKISTQATVYHQMLLKMLHVANYGFDEGKLKAEYISFIEIYPKLRKPKDDRPFNETSPGPSDDINRENFIAVLKVLSTFNIATECISRTVHRTQDTGDTSHWFH